MDQHDPIPQQSPVEAVRAWRLLPRAARRSAWSQANRLRHAGSSRYPWSPLPPVSPLQAHMRSGRAHPQSQNTAAVSMGFNRAQRRAMKAKSGPKAPSYRVVRRHVKQARSNPGSRQRAGLRVDLGGTGKVVAAGGLDRSGSAVAGSAFHDHRSLPPKVNTSVIDRPTQPHRLNKFVLRQMFTLNVAQRFQEIKADRVWHRRLWRAILRMILQVGRWFQRATPWLNRRRS